MYKTDQVPTLQEHNVEINKWICDNKLASGGREVKKWQVKKRGCGRGVALDRVVRVGPFEQVMFEQSPQWSAQQRLLAAGWRTIQWRRTKMFCGRNVLSIFEKSQLSSGLKQNEVAEERWDIRDKKSLGRDPFGLCRNGK